ncbi:MAG: outer membrane beta-barrel protein, partial [Bacteroidetes bacterium]|nr:outer membrane beta-barrel protein [Bacteroidota bacterium]
TTGNPAKGTDKDLTKDKDQGSAGDQSQKNNPVAAGVPADSPAITPVAVQPSHADSVPAAKKPADTLVVAKNDSTKKKNDKKRQKAISIGLVGGTDISTVKFDYGSSMGYNIGLLAGYHFGSNWSVHTGAIYTRKNYKMEGYNYHAPGGTFPPSYKLETVEGYCRMWEVPVTARYTFNGKPSARWFVSGGLSSYFMTSEYYDYTFKWGNNPTLYPGHWSTTKNSQYWFSILSISGGLEKSFGTHVSALLEPYAKLPLGGVGNGKIMLSSFGLNVIFQYKKGIGKK